LKPSPFAPVAFAVAGEVELAGASGERIGGFLLWRRIGRGVRRRLYRYWGVDL
jgi:hypothetical protein